MAGLDESKTKVKQEKIYYLLIFSKDGLDTCSISNIIFFWICRSSPYTTSPTFYY